MKRTPLLIGGTLIVAVIAYAVKSQGGEAVPEIEYRYAKVEKGELLRSISATGIAVASTTVDVKSKAGGNVIRLLVAEGSRVKKGDLIALIDPADTQSIYDQAAADLRSSDARASQADSNVDLQIAQSATTLADARAALDAAKVRLRRAAIEEKRQPSLTDSAVRTAQANLDSATAAVERLEKVTIPQNNRDAQSALEQAEVGRNIAQSVLKRQESLVEKGYVATSAVETARNALAQAEAAYQNAKQRSQTLEAAQSADLRSSRLEVARAEAAVGQAKANIAQDDVARTNLAEAREAVRQAEIAVTRAVGDQQQIGIRRRDVDAARAATVRSRVAVQNAKTQLDSTRVYAPRDGVVTMKYLEEGTIIPPGTSTFAEGTSLVQLADVTQLFIECAVDEADVGNVKAGQAVRIISEAYPNETLE
ncbi:HlyD family efflux transporter periplasmic adaptor subunit, partial [bacterium]